MPVDLLAAIDSIPSAEAVIYNQIVFLPNQKRELALLDKKKNRHASIPNPSNQMAVEDIKRVQEVIARESKQLVYTHFNLIVAVPTGTDLQNARTIGECFRTYGYPYFQKGVQPAGTVRKLVSG